MLLPEGRVRVVVEGVRPEIDCGAISAERTVGEFVVVDLGIFTDRQLGVVFNPCVQDADDQPAGYP